jgi:hypothetical protein
MDLNYIIIVVLAILGIFLAVRLMYSERYAGWLERSNTSLSVELFELKTENADLKGQLKRLRKKLEADASGQVARDPETGRFTKEQSECN